ncbi:hypothetical protein [Limnohabitans sp. 2KL-3]|uniref:hypothetical protein n=1 Tax=Limnohabitans sp. 2KL-3 TaxID=1100700 RepID=UPI001892B79F|nr:hypothetical protein [Limnohabitans sp. 2KL-3]
MNLRTVATKRIEFLADLGGIAFSLSGATAAAVFGKALLAVVLGALALGFFLRISGRRVASDPSALRTPRWILAVSGLLSLVEVGVLVEATNLPVRFTQNGFELFHWALVLLAFIVAFFIQVRVLISVVMQRRGSHVL